MYDHSIKIYRFYIYHLQFIEHLLQQIICRFKVINFYINNSVEVGLF